MSLHKDPSKRRLSFHKPPPNIHPQAHRRQLALEAQKERRQHAFMQARSIQASTIDSMGDLAISDASDNELDSNSTSTSPTRNRAANTAANGHQTERQQRLAARPAYHHWAKNLLQYAETLDLHAGLPDSLGEGWCVSVVPRGKRCLVATRGGYDDHNSILLSRVAGRMLARKQTVLPPDCLIDCVWDETLGVLWALDLVRWRGVWYVDHETQFRSFFLASKLSELPVQPYLPPSPSPTASSFPPTSTNLASSALALVLPVPSRSSPLTPSVLLPLIDSLTSPSSLSTSVLLPSIPSAFANSPGSHLPPPHQETISIPFSPTGLVLSLSEARYESGQTALAGWIPLDVEQGRENLEGVGRFRELVMEWGRVEEMELERQREAGRGEEMRR